MDELGRSSKVSRPSIAMGRIGPPLLSKILFESHILKLKLGGDLGLMKLSNCDPAELSLELSKQVLEAANHEKHVGSSGEASFASLACIAPTIGVPILLADDSMPEVRILQTPSPLVTRSS